MSTLELTKQQVEDALKHLPVFQMGRLSDMLDCYVHGDFVGPALQAHGVTMEQYRKDQLKYEKLADNFSRAILKLTNIPYETFPEQALRAALQQLSGPTVPKKN